MTPDEDFAYRASLADVRSIAFNSDAELGDTSGNLMGNVGIGKSTYNAKIAAPYIDRKTFASGSGSLCFDIPDLWVNGMGSFYANFSADYSKFPAHFFVQFRYRQDAFMYHTVYLATGGGATNPKLADINAGDQKPGLAPWAGDGITHFSSSGGWVRKPPWISGDTKVVVIPYRAHKFPVSYHYWPNAAGGTSDVGLYVGDNLQNAMPSPPGCLHKTMLAVDAVNPGGTVTGCWTMLPDEWATFQIEVKLGPKQLYPTVYKTTAYPQGFQYEVWSNTEVRIWGAHEGEPSQLILDWNPGVAGYQPLLSGYRTIDGANLDFKLGKVWLMPFMTGRDPTISYGGVGHCWYDELLIGTQRFPDPQTKSTGVSAMPTPAQQTVLDDAEKTLNDACAEAGVALSSIPSVASAISAAVTAASSALQAKVAAGLTAAQATVTALS